MRKKQHYDEKQLQDRGKIYQISFFIAIMVFVAMYLVTGAAEIAVSEYTRLMVCLWVPVSVCIILMIAKNAYEGVGSTAGRVAAPVLGAAGIYQLVVNMIEMVQNRTGFWSDHMINDYVGSMLMGLCMVCVCAAYWIQYYRNKKKFAE